MTWSYSDPSQSDKDAVRFEIQDTNSNAQLLSDEEINWAILSETTLTAGTPTTLSTGDLYRSAARCMEVLERLFAAQADTAIGSLHVTYSKQAASYAQRAAELRARAIGMNAPYVGGLSKQEDKSDESNFDLVQPFFRRRQDDNPFTGPPSANLGPHLQ